MTHLSRELIYLCIDMDQKRLTSPIIVEVDAIDAVIQLINTFYLPFLDAADPKAFITAYVSGSYELLALNAFEANHKKLDVGIHLCYLIINIASSETILEGKPTVGIRQILHAIYTNPNLKEMFRRLEALTKGPTLPPPSVYEKLIGDPRHLDQQSVIIKDIDAIMLNVEADVKLCTGYVVEYIDAVIDADTLTYLMANVPHIIDRRSLWTYIIQVIYDHMMDHRDDDDSPLSFKNYLNAVINNSYWNLTFFLQLPIPNLFY